MIDPLQTLRARKARFLQWFIWLALAGAAVLNAAMSGWLPAPQENTAFPAVTLLGLNREVVALHGLAGQSGANFQSYGATVLEWLFLFLGPFVVIGLIYLLLKRKYKNCLRLIGMYALLFFSQVGNITDVKGQTTVAFQGGDVAPSHLVRLEQLALSSDPSARLAAGQFRFVFSNKSMADFGQRQFARQYGSKRNIVFVAPEKVDRVDARFVHSFLARLAYLKGDLDVAQFHIRKLGPEVADAISWQHFLVAEWLVANDRDIGIAGPEIEARFQALRDRRMLSTIGVVTGAALMLFSIVALCLVLVISLRSKRLDRFMTQRASYVAAENRLSS